MPVNLLVNARVVGHFQLVQISPFVRSATATGHTLTSVIHLPSHSFEYYSHAMICSSSRAMDDILLSDFRQSNSFDFSIFEVGVGISTASWQVSRSLRGFTGELGRRGRKGEGGREVNTGWSRTAGRQPAAKLADHTLT